MYAKEIDSQQSLICFCVPELYRRMLKLTKENEKINNDLIKNLKKKVLYYKQIDMLVYLLYQ